MYSDAEIPQAMQRLASWQGLAKVSQWAFPDKNPDHLSQILLRITSVKQFQQQIMSPLAHTIIDKTSQGLTCSGLDLVSNTPTIYISDHRDIVLDAYFLQMILNDEGLETSCIVSGNNLLVNQAIVDIASSNKLIPIGRGGSKRSWGEELLAMSQTLRSTLENGQSVWIAQRNGRTKDNIDRTDPAIIHMLAASGPISNYRVMPLTITYELEPNASYKAQYLWGIDNPHEQQPENYLAQIVESMLQPKGHIHYTFHNPIDMSQPEGMSQKDYYHTIAKRVDEAILSGYRQWPESDIVRRQWQQLIDSTPAEVQPYMKTFAPDWAK